MKLGASYISPSPPLIHWNFPTSLELKDKGQSVNINIMNIFKKKKY